MEIPVELSRFVQELAKNSTYKFHIQPLEDKNRFKVIWSKPTQQKPIPEAVINTYFLISPDKKIRFRIETNSFEYSSPDQLQFENVLNDVVNSKQISKNAL